MPLPEPERNIIHEYCIRDLGGAIDWYIDQFSFITDVELRTRLGRAFYTARYVYKLMEALFVNGDELHAFVKFQVMQYASIYEAVISNLLWGRFRAHPAVIELENHKVLTKVPGFSRSLSCTFEGQEVQTCVYRPTKKQHNSIRFGEKVNCAVEVGFVQKAYAEEIKQLYNLRNLAHIENEADKQIDIELEHARNAYWRMQPFLKHISDTLTSQ